MLMVIVVNVGFLFIPFINFHSANPSMICYLSLTLLLFAREAHLRRVR
jgi:hypothetical protein